jgi:uncharacterized glyoxalase superfamily protein PhnB
MTTQNPPAGMPQCCPNVFYDDVAAAVRFLCEAFGFEQRFAHAAPDGRVEHAQLGYGSAVVMLGGTGNPRALRPVKSPKTAGLVTGAVYLFVDDVDGHCARARAAGAEVVHEPMDMFWGDRIYCAVDPEGQFWTFATHVRDVKM